MYNIRRIYFALFFSIFLPISLMSSGVYARPTVKLLIYPDIQGKVIIEDVPRIWITAKSSEKNVTFKWTHKGSRELIELLEYVRVYKVPDKIDGESEEVTITVTVHNNKGEETINEVTFTLLPGPIHIRQVLLREENGTIIKPTYFVKSGGIVTIDIDINIPPNRNVRVECDAILGEVAYHQQKIIYVTPEKPGGADIVTIRAVDNDTGNITTQELINIIVRDKK